MGMGDKQEPYKPKYFPIRCDVTGKLFPPISVRLCKEPHVVKKYGVGGVCNVSVLICKRCRYGERHDLCDAWRCVYGLDEKLPS